MLRTLASASLLATAGAMQLTASSVRQALPEDGSQILVASEAQESQVAAQAEMTITEMCKSCNWDCYLKRFPALKNKQWEAEHPQKGLEYAKLHYIKFGRAAGRSCQCDADMLAAKLVEQPWDAARLQGQLAEQTEVLAEAAAEVELIKGCNWNCYVERYPKLRNEKWEQEKGNQDYARSHYLKFGRVAGKNCKCGAGPKNLITGASLLGYQPGSVNCADLNGQYKNKLGKVVTVKQTNCDAEVSSVWDDAEGEVTKKGHVGGNSLHVNDFDKIGTVMGKDVEFPDGALWEKVEEGSQILVEKLALDDAQESQITAQAEMTIAEMCKSCNWDCYLRRYPGLKNKQWEAQHPQKKFEYVKTQYLKFGRAAGRSCQCDADMLADKFVEQPWDAARLQAQLAEQTEVLAEAAAEVELIKGCDWNCYLDRYPKLRNEKWEAEWKHKEGNLDYARSHYLRFGRAAGKNCKCEGGK